MHRKREIHRNLFDDFDNTDDDLEVCDDLTDADILPSVTSSMHYPFDEEEEQDCTELTQAQIHNHELRRFIGNQQGVRDELKNNN